MGAVVIERQLAHAAVAPSGLRGVADDALRVGLPGALASGVQIAVRTRLAAARAGGHAGHAAAGVEQLRAHPEVVRAAAGFRPQLGSLATQDATRARALIEATLHGLEPVVVVNRRLHPADAAAWDADGYLLTMNTAEVRGLGLQARQAIRGSWEYALGKYGDGPLRGRTAYGSLQLVPRGMDLAGAVSDSVAGALGAHPGFGVRAFGRHALELAPSVRSRATLAARDSGPVPDAPYLAPMDRLPDVLLERLARTHGFQPDVAVHGRPDRIGILGPATSAGSRRGQLLEWLRAPATDGVRALDRYLRSAAMRDVDHMVEVQVRGVRSGDIARIHLER